MWPTRLTKRWNPIIYLQSTFWRLLLIKTRLLKRYSSNNIGAVAAVPDAAGSTTATSTTTTAKWLKGNEILCTVCVRGVATGIAWTYHYAGEVWVYRRRVCPHAVTYRDMQVSVTWLQARFRWHVNEPSMLSHTWVARVCFRPFLSWSWKHNLRVWNLWCKRNPDSCCHRRYSRTEYSSCTGPGLMRKQL